MSSNDPYEVLAIPHNANPAEVAAAYERLRSVYNLERFVDGPPGLLAEAAAKQAELLAAYQTLNLTRMAAETASGDVVGSHVLHVKAGAQQIQDAVQGDDSSTDRPADPAGAATWPPRLADPRDQFLKAPGPQLELDFRPLPPARRAERPPRGQLRVAEANGETGAEQRTPLAIGMKTPPWLALLVLAGLTLLLFAAVSLPGVRTSTRSEALATPAIADVRLPFTPTQIEEKRRAATSQPSPESWAAVGDALFDNLETMREAAPLSSQYLNAASQWNDAAEAYRRSLAMHDDPIVRSDLALALVYGGDATNDGAKVAQGRLEAEQAKRQAPDQARVSVQYGLMLVALNPPRIEEAVATWRQVVQTATDTGERQRAQRLLTSYQ
ncbi:MAG: DnaJ domain-containing protein [Herpetosiphon sp.]